MIMSAEFIVEGAIYEYLIVNPVYCNVIHWYVFIVCAIHCVQYSNISVNVWYYVVLIYYSRISFENLIHNFQILQ